MKIFSLVHILLTLPSLIQAQSPLTSLSLEERPEGITEGPGSTVFVSQILSGRVVQMDVLTGESNEVVPAQSSGQQAWGLWWHEDSNSIWVAGGGAPYGNGLPELYVYDVETGSNIVTCQPLPHTNSTGTMEAQDPFLNDVTIVGDYAYVTDSFSQKLMVLDVAEALEGNCVQSELYLPIDFLPSSGDDWGTNGLAAYSPSNSSSTGLFLADEVDGAIWYLWNLGEVTEAAMMMSSDDNDMAESTADVLPLYQLVVEEGGAGGADGLFVRDHKLYVTQNYENVIGVYAILLEPDYENTMTLTRIGNLTSPDFDTPATSAWKEGYVYSANSRFVTLPEIETEAENNVIGVYDDFQDYDVGDMDMEMTDSDNSINDEELVEKNEEDDNKATSGVVGDAYWKFKTTSSVTMVVASGMMWMMMMMAVYY